MAFHPTFTPVPRTSDEKHRSKSPPPRAPKPAGTAPLSSSASAARPVPVHHARATKPPGTDGEPLAVSLEKESGAGAGGEEKGLGGEPFATYADDVRELVAALRRALEEEEEEEEGGKEEESREKKNNKLSEAASVARAFLHQQLRLAGDAERRSLAELKGAVKGLLLFEDRREELRRRRRQREAGAAEEEAEEEEKEEEEKAEKQTERLPEELRKEVRRGLESTLAVLLVEEESAREKGLLH